MSQVILSFLPWCWFIPAVFTNTDESNFFLKKVTGKREIQKAFKYSIFSSDGSETVLVTFMLKGIIEKLKSLILGKVAERFWCSFFV